MSDPSEQQREPDAPDLEVETVKDLEVADEDGDKVRGGHTNTCACLGTHLPS